MEERDLRVGDTVKMGEALTTLVKQDGLRWTWLFLETGTIVAVDYTRVELDVSVNRDGPHGMTSRLFARVNP